MEQSRALHRAWGGVLPRTSIIGSPGRRHATRGRSVSFGNIQRPSSFNVIHITNDVVAGLDVINRHLVPGGNIRKGVAGLDFITGHSKSPNCFPLLSFVPQASMPVAP